MLSFGVSIEMSMSVIWWKVAVGTSACGLLSPAMLASDFLALSLNFSVIFSPFPSSNHCREKKANKEQALFSAFSGYHSPLLRGWRDNFSLWWFSKACRWWIYSRTCACDAVNVSPLCAFYGTPSLHKKREIETSDMKLSPFLICECITETTTVSFILSVLQGFGTAMMMTGVKFKSSEIFNGYINKKRAVPADFSFKKFFFCFVCFFKKQHWLSPTKLQRRQRY